MKKLLRSITVCTLSVLLFAASAFADNDPRDYIPLPAGTTLIASYFSHIGATEYYVKGKKTANNMDLSANIGMIRPVYYMKLGPFTIDPQAIIPFGVQTLQTNAGAGGEISSTGFADPIVTATVWFINDPASKTYLGFTPWFFLPLGEYDNTKAVNLGGNRFMFREEVGFAKGFGDLNVDLTASVDFFTDNNKFGAANQKLSQEPVFNFETHISYDFNKSFFTSFDYFYHNGGKTTLAGVKNDDAIDTHAAGLTMGFMLSPSYQLLFKLKQDMAVENGLKTTTIGTRLAYFF